MGLRDQAKQDIEGITSNKESGFGIDMIFTAPTSETATITGISSVIHLGVDTDGNMVNAKKAHISFSEKFLIDAGYPVRNAQNQVDLVGHIIQVKDSAQILRKYQMQNIFPNETVGLITCTLEDYAE